MDTMKKISWRHSIKFQMSISLCIMMMIVSMLFGLEQYTRTKSRLIQEFNDLAEFSTSRLAESLIWPIWNLDKQQIVNIFISEMKDKRMYAIVLKDADNGELLWGRVRNEKWEVIELESLEGEERLSNDLMMVPKDIVRGNDTVGRLEVYLTPQFMQAELREQILKMLMSITLVGLAMLIVVRRFVSMLTVPIEKIAEITNDIAAGKFTQTTSIQQDNEIGLLAEENRHVQQTLQHVIGETETFLQSIEQRSFDFQGDVEAVNGKWRELVTRMNSVTETLRSQKARKA